MNAPSNSAKYGSRGETSGPRMTKSLRNRLRVVAAHSELKMNAWIEQKIIEDEVKFGIVPAAGDGTNE